MSGPTLYLVRHGETDWNAEGRLQGQRDIALNPKGRVQAVEAAGRLVSLVSDPAGLDFVASPLGRCRETMEILRSELSLAPAGYRLDERLREISFGRWEGMTWKEVRAREGGGVTQRERRKWDFVPPGGESYAMLTTRLAPFLDDIVRDTVVVSHGGIARAILAARAGLPAERASREDIWQGRILIVTSGHYVWR